MIETSTREARGYFLLEFTRQLIKNNKNINIYLLDQILKEKFPEKKEVPIITREGIQEKIDQRKKPFGESSEVLIKELKKTPPTIYNTRNLIKGNKRVLKVPEPVSPQRLDYLKPTHPPEVPNLPKISILIKDPNVKTVEVEGANQKAVVVGTMGRKSTNIVITKEEINKILQTFSTKSKIPISEGITKIALGDLTLTSIKSNEDIHFIIRKNPQNPVPRPFYT